MRKCGFATHRPAFACASVVHVSIEHVPMDFTAIDFETANASAASACSVGLVKVRDGEVVDRVGWLIKPPFGHDDFTEWNTRIHGIMAPDVIDAKLWSEQVDDIIAFAEDDVLVAHNAGFDMGVITSACTASYIGTPEYAYLCSLQVARKTYHLESYRLPVAAMAAGFEGFKHHDAIADAEACARIVIHAARRHDAYDTTSLAEVLGIRIGRIGKPAPETSVPWVPPATAAQSDAPRWSIPGVQFR
jgi:DNA polymerase-3 subunit epsilon